MAMLKKPWVLGVIGALEGVGVAFAVLTFVLGGGDDGEAATPPVDPTPVATEGKLGPHMVLADRVFNLISPPAAPVYLKLQTVVEFQTTDERWAHVLHGCARAFEVAPAPMVSLVPVAPVASVAPASGGAEGRGNACQTEELALLAEFDAQVGTGRQLVEDAVTSIVTGKTPEEVATAEGKEALKAEIQAAVQERLPGMVVTRVLFTNFITQ